MLSSYLYNTENFEQVRANLVYTPYISENILIMSFNRDINYHTCSIENKNWTLDILKERFERELKMHSAAADIIPVINKLWVNTDTREIAFAWPGVDFYEETKHLTKITVNNWKEQWASSLTELWKNNIVKISLHPNSVCNDEGKLKWLNWFFSFHVDESLLSIDDILIQVSSGRQEELFKILDNLNIKTNRKLTFFELQALALLSFKKNYPHQLINDLLNILEKEHNNGNRFFTY